MPDKPHSKLGIVSFALSLVLWVLIIALICMAGLAANSATPPDKAYMAALGVGIIASILGALVSLGLGIAGVCQADKKKIFGILGLVFSALYIFFIIVLILIGVASRHSNGY